MPACSKFPAYPRLPEDVLHKVHYLRFMVHPGSKKMYHDFCWSSWWPGLKKDILDIVLWWFFCQQVKIKHKRLGGLLQLLPPLEWKWNCITCDFVLHLLPSRCQMLYMGLHYVYLYYIIIVTKANNHRQGVQASKSRNTTRSNLGYRILIWLQLCTSVRET